MKATASMAGLPKQDLILLTVKAHQIEPIVKDLVQIMAPHTVIIPFQNGIPWWYFQQNPNPKAQPYKDYIIRSVDPNGVLTSSIPTRNIVGGIPYPAAYIAEPGVVKHVEGDRFPIGELDGKTDTPRILAIHKVIKDAGCKCFILTDIRDELWVKLWGNLTFNPLSAVTHATLKGLTEYPLTRQVAKNMMTEARVVAEKLGITFRVSMDKRIAAAGEIEHKSSMLQDTEAGRELEIDAMTGAVVELAELTKTPVPHIYCIYACVKLLSHTITSQHVAFPASKL